MRIKAPKGRGTEREYGSPSIYFNDRVDGAPESLCSAFNANHVSTAQPFDHPRRCMVGDQGVNDVPLRADHDIDVVPTAGEPVCCVTPRVNRSL
ncbi:hypothetical protein GCM10011333_06350 [Sediminivirga luteola]|uniref:Uncharacterized protein n=1 Tax=Sediminivirga luteola TaxID=1774748 RepID=A0A8J2TVY5_9MICO|nr:hypothetical protein GCM10011333_06350 [Sediminivirga luteola]